MKRDYSNWSKDELVKELKKVEKRKKYGIVWENKTEQVAELCKTKLPILVEERSKKIKTRKSDLENFLIEGDNYHALSVLNYTHKGVIDVIYIDPPYNTGNGDSFRYNDKIVDNEDPYRHSKWISFMNKRLLLAKNLLSQTGLIFISINDSEVAQLKLLCDDIFDEKNFVSILVWKTRQNVDSRSLTGVSIDHEYVLVYRKSVKARLRGRGINKEKYKNPDNDPRGPWMSSPMDGIATKDRRPNLHYTIINQKTGNKYEPSPETGWRFSKDTVQKLIIENRVIWPRNPNSKPRFKRYLYELKSEHTGFSSILEADYTLFGTKELRELMGSEAFKFPKPSTLIEQFIEQHHDKNALVLDFFAGSGTTAQSVLQLNARDDGNRKFILCTDNENNICTEVCYPRIKKVFARLGAGSLRYFQTDFVDAEPTDKNKRKLVDKSTEMLCLKEDCFDELTKGQSYRIFTNGQNKYLGIIYDDDGIVSLKKEVKKLDKKFVVYVFSLDDSAREEEFEDVAKLVELRPIPAVILNVYRRIFK